LAGQTAIEGAGGKRQYFCSGRVDATDGTGSEGLAPRVYEPPLVSVIDDMQVKGLTTKEAIALMVRPTGKSLTNKFFKDMLGTNLTSFTKYELAWLEDAEGFRIINEYANSARLFQKEFAKAWNKIMTIDRYDGPFANACEGVNTCTTTPCLAQ
jgi:Peroxidase